MTTAPITPEQAQRFKRLAWPMLPVVLRTAGYLTHRADQAEDLAQDTMLKAMRAIDSYQDGTDIRAWLLTILRRTHIDRVRAQRARPGEVPLEEAWALADAAPDPAESAGSAEAPWEAPEALLQRFEDQAVIDALRSLPDDLRWTLLLVDVERMEQAQAAAVLGVAVGTIKSRTHRGRALLRDRLYGLAQRRGWVPAQEPTP